MKTRYIQSAGEFLDIAGDDLLVDEIRHSLTYGIAEKISHDPNLFGKGQPWFIVLEEGGQIRGTAIRTPPLHRAILAYLSGE